MQQLELRVTGMTCGACERRIERALGRVAGVVRSAANHRGSQVRVVFDTARTSAEAIRSCVEQAGYGVVE